MSNAIDGTERWWQSPPLSRGLEYNEVNVTLDLGQVGSPASAAVAMGRCGRPSVDRCVAVSTPAAPSRRGGREGASQRSQLGSGDSLEAGPDAGRPWCLLGGIPLPGAWRCLAAVGGAPGARRRCWKWTFLAYLRLGGHLGVRCSCSGHSSVLSLAFGALAQGEVISQ